MTPAKRDAITRQKNTIGGGGRNQSVKIYTTKRQKSRVLGRSLFLGFVVISCLSYIMILLGDV
ncbi:MAG: hypothetical protein ACFFB0_19145 [Promethearchaeota archaeon]